MAQLRRSAAGAAATSRGWRGCGFPAMARLRIGLRRERGCDSDFGESAAAIRTSARARLRFGLRRERGCDSAAGPGWRAPPALAALRFAAGCPRRRASRGKQGDACLRRAAPSLRRRPRDVLRRGQPAAKRRAASAGGARHPGPAADSQPRSRRSLIRSRALARNPPPRHPREVAPAPVAERRSCAMDRAPRRTVRAPHRDLCRSTGLRLAG